MEVYTRSSWFLLLLGFALIAATLQETTPDCPTPEQVSCKSGTKCSEDDDCQDNELCCSNSCYTKRCVPLSIGVRGDADGPSETDCRPFIEKALKELEIGETQKDDADDNEDDDKKDDSVEDVPTVEITDDSSPELEEVTDANDPQSDEAEAEAVQQSVEQDDSGETPDEKEVEESDEITKEQSTEQPEADDDESQEAAAEEPIIVKREAPTLQQPIVEDVIQTSPEVHSKEDPETVEIQGRSQETSKEETAQAPTDDSIEEIETQATSKEDSKSEEHIQQVSAESQEESGCPPPNEVSCTEGELCTKHRQCGDNQICCSNKCYRKRCVEGTVPQAELDAESASEESVETKSQETITANKPTEGGCPSASDISCTEGNPCTKHRHCGDNQICCTNKCYRKHCVDGTVSQEELDAESASEESVETKSAEAAAAPSVPSEGGCPTSSDLPCTEGEPCTKHRHCGDSKICCTNKCYRKRCVDGTVPQEELDAESASEESIETKSEEAVTPASPETGCPSPQDVSCTEGELCAKHRHCQDGTICCPNKCYRRRCTTGTATSAELAEESESEEDEVEAKKDDTSPEKTAKPETGCPSPGDVSCVEGDLCSKHRHCGGNEICCPNKCYRKRCTRGTATEDELAAESESEESAEVEAAAAPAPKRQKDTGCPERDEVPCGGEACLKRKECDQGEICCANKCYRKVCVPGTPGSDEEDEDSDETEEGAKDEASAETAAESQEDGTEDDGCPSPDKVSCTEGVRCGEDDDCGSSEICCPNKCYNKRCVAGTNQDSVEESDEEEPPVKASPPPPPPPAPKVEVPKKVEPKQEVKPKSAPPPPPPPPKVTKPAPKVEIKVPVRVVEPIFEDDESVEDGEALVEELSVDTGAPTELRPRDHVEHLLKLDQSSTKLETVHNRVYEDTLKELKRLYENAIKPLEIVYKYRDLSNRHFGDAEIFSKPLILFMGPWSGGKSSIINYLTNNEFNETALRTGAEPSPAYFNILMHGNEPEIIDGTELAADFTFSGLQKFGQGLEERLRGVKLPSKLLEKVNIVEIPGILEVRKQVSRLFPFNDACQWFIDRADIIFLVYDPSKLDVGPETEAILDQLKGREHQTRIVLNKADQVKPEELMRVQGALIWNISPLMSSPQPPVMYTTSLWSRPYEPWAPVKLLQAQERAFLRDLRTAVDRRVENKIASARRFAVRVRNHAKMVDCYLTTYYNHKSVFGNRKQVANEIIDHPQDYHIYEGLSTLTNISRYDLPDPEVYRDFFKLNPLYEFQQLSATCTYFRGCPINRLDIAIAYDLPELVGTYKRNLEEAITNANNPPKETAPKKKSKKDAPGS